MRADSEQPYAVVEFLDVASDDADDFAPDELAAADSPLRRWHLLAGGLVAGALVAAAILDATQPTHAPPAPAAPPAVVAAVDRPAVPLSGNLYGCPDPRGCQTAGEFSVAVQRAITRDLPGSLISSELVVVDTKGRLQSRQVNGIAAGGVLIVVRVLSASASTNRTPAVVLQRLVGETEVGYVRTEIMGGFQLQVQLTGPADWVPPIDRMQLLAHDARLRSAAIPDAGPIWASRGHRHHDRDHH